MSDTPATMTNSQAALLASIEHHGNATHRPSTYTILSTADEFLRWLDSGEQ